MLNKSIRNSLVLTSILSFCGAVVAEETACLMEGSFSIGSVKTEIKDCLKNNGIPKARFKETCSSLASATTAFGGPAAEITYLAECPVESQGSCEGFYGQPMTSYYYKRDAKLLATTKTSCEAQGGKWK